MHLEIRIRTDWRLGKGSGEEDGKGTGVGPSRCIWWGIGRAWHGASVEYLAYLKEKSNRIRDCGCVLVYVI